ncbi:MAG: hypothetical protein U0S36_02540 [Candidatus Nanopelagicales bacterium]
MQDETCCADCGVPTPTNSGQEAAAAKAGCPLTSLVWVLIPLLLILVVVIVAGISR